MQEKKLHFWTDGSCKGNPGNERADELANMGFVSV